ncbi:MAG TPA: hypothetical protein VFE60_05365 [Roseiarcus sp.]|jgi:hypothetical protein|nr:hypothetical protein [Roseiarcus sp.]
MMCPQVTEKALLIPRVTHWPQHGGWRYEVVISDGGLGDIIIGEPVATLEEAHSQACYDAVPRYR